MPVPELPPLPFREAIAALRAKLALPTARWTDLWEGEHARAFAVAGALADDLVSDFRDAIVAALESGTSVRDWRATFEAIVARHSWRGWTGEGTEKGRRWRARVIYDTNIRTSHAIGRWRQQQDGAARRPYLRYTAVLDGATRPEHRAWHGTILPIDHPWWQTHYPPNGWYCRCQAVQVSSRDIERRGWGVTENPPPMDWRPVQVRGRGVVMTPAGIDPGFAYNPGEEAGAAD